MNDVATIINSLRAKVGKLIEEYISLKDRNKRLEEEIIVLKKSINDQDKLIKEINNNKEVRIVSNNLKTVEGKDEIAGKVEELIQDIDRCIDLMKADQF